MSSFVYRTRPTKKALAKAIESIKLLVISLFPVRLCKCHICEHKVPISPTVPLLIRQSPRKTPPSYLPYHAHTFSHDPPCSTHGRNPFLTITFLTSLHKSNAVGRLM